MNAGPEPYVLKRWRRDVAKKDHTNMTQSNSRLFDDLGRLMTDAAGLADGVRREVETVARSQMERMVATMDLAREEDIDVLRDMVAKQREANEALEARVAALEAQIATMSGEKPADASTD
jgi:BMFP domain-containing protein YqiC